MKALKIFAIVFIVIEQINAFDLPAEIRIGTCDIIASVKVLIILFFFLGAIFDTYDILSRQAFEYAVAKINTQSKIFRNSKIVVNQIDTVDALNSFAAYKMGKKKKKFPF